MDSNAISGYFTYIMGDSNSSTSAYIQLLENEADQLEVQIKAKWAETNQNLLRILQSSTTRCLIGTPGSTL